MLIDVVKIPCAFIKITEREQQAAQLIIMFNGNRHHADFYSVLFHLRTSKNPAPVK